MKLLRALLATLLVAGVPTGAQAAWLGYSGYWECILEEMKAVSDDGTARNVLRSCKQRYPDISQVTPRNSWFGIQTRQQCRDSYAGKGSSARAEKLIGVACSRLYPR